MNTITNTRYQKQHLTPGEVKSGKKLKRNKKYKKTKTTINVKGNYSLQNGKGIYA